MGKRLLDLALVIPGLVAIAPLMVAIALWVRFDSPGPALFRQHRVGRYGNPFYVLKFRTMVRDAEARGAKVTVGGDPRITQAGHFLRKYKLDELPQLINVLKGEMSLVGPRPEVPEYVAHYPQSVKEKVLSVRPGITDYAAIEFRNENELLENAPDPHQYYLESILPKKLNYYCKYVDNRSFMVDITLIIRTIEAIIRR